MKKIKLSEIKKLYKEFEDVNFNDKFNDFDKLVYFRKPSNLKFRDLNGFIFGINHEKSESIEYDIPYLKYKFIENLDELFISDISNLNVLLLLADREIIEIGKGEQ